MMKELAPIILAEIKKAHSILLHCHPSPDPDSVGSALAMKFALEQIGKKSTVIKGDSDFPRGFEHFPGASDIVHKNFFEINQADYDLFLVLDTAALDRISFRGKVDFPKTMTVINIDHHGTNPGFGKISLVDPSYPSTAQMLFDLFKEWKIKMTPEIAANLFIGIYSDTGGFRFKGTTDKTLAAASALVKVYPDFAKLISDMENTDTPESMAFYGYALSNIEKFFGGKFAVSKVPFSEVQTLNLHNAESGPSDIASMMNSVADWKVSGCAVEFEPGKVKFSFRSRDEVNYNVAKLVTEFGGGGHPMAAGVLVAGSLDEVVKKVVNKAKEMYNL